MDEPKYSLRMMWLVLMAMELINFDPDEVEAGIKRLCSNPKFVINIRYQGAFRIWLCNLSSLSQRKMLDYAKDSKNIYGI